MCSTEGALDLNLWGVEIRLIPSTKAFFDLGSSLQPLRWSLGKIIEPIIVLVGLNGVKLGEHQCRRWTHPALHE